MKDEDYYIRVLLYFTLGPPVAIFFLWACYMVYEYAGPGVMYFE